MAKDLIIVESPAKVKTIKKFLGNNYAVEASVGHVRDLPANAIGVDEEHDFAPQYQVIEGKEKVVNALREAAAKAENIYLAPDPDREGEAIAWHVAELIGDKNKHIQRIQFNEITARAVREALEHPRPLDRNLFDAQQARRVLDRLVGYKISPLLWKKIKRGISAGRVQSVALRLVVDRERERFAFRAEEYWEFKATLAGGNQQPFRADLAQIKGKKAHIPDAKAAAKVEALLKDNDFLVADVQQKERKREPQPPFITSTLQQAASQRLGYAAKRTMGIAQRLYEGVDAGPQGTLALITYMRTDSVRIADEARKAAAEYIASAFGKEYLPASARKFKTKGSAQDAHEAIRPIDVTITPDSLKGVLEGEQYQLYRLIWSRFVASQMAAAVFHDTSVEINRGETLWRAKGERLLFPGFFAAAPYLRDDQPDLPELAAGEKLTLLPPGVEKEQKFTQPPARYSEASLVRELEERGIGRPSTYAAILATLQERDYARVASKHFVPTDLGMTVSDQLVRHFPELMDVDFTAQMEGSLDKVADGKTDWVRLLKDFNKDFKPALALAEKDMGGVKGGLPSGVDCESCGKPMLIKFGKAGPFLACSGYPECRTTRNFKRDDQGNIVVEEKVKPELEKVGTCPQCGGDLVVKKARTGGRFIACANYPDCTYAASFSTGVPCPRPGCGGTIVEKTSKRGKTFYSCDQFPKCDYALWDYPVPGPCPVCDSPLLVRKSTRAKGERIACPEKGCNYSREIDDATAASDLDNAE